MSDMLKVFAEDLKAVRLEKKLTLKSISQQTRLNVTILENIESGDFNFQPQAYIRAFLKQYINCLELDPEETMFDYDLAKSNKYKSKRTGVSKTQEPVIEKKVSAEDEILKKTPPENPKGEPETPIEIADEKKTDATPEPEPAKIPPTAKKDTEVIPESKTQPQPITGKNYDYSQPQKEKKKISFSFQNSPVVRNISMILFAALVLIGLYSLVNILFFEGSNDKPEVIRQNFDDVVKEQEQKILNKRTPEEIQDSIKKAEMESALANDSITLKITGVSSGVLYLVTDSLNIRKPQKVQYEKNDVMMFKAQKMFFISSDETGSFRATVNDVPLKFSETDVSRVRVDRDGVAK